MDRWTDIQTDVRTDGCTYRRTHGRTMLVVKSLSQLKRKKSVKMIRKKCQRRKKGQKKGLSPIIDRPTHPLTDRTESRNTIASKEHT